MCSQHTRCLVSCSYLSFPGFPSEPTNVELHVDGVGDICTKGGDINFVFTGFSVNGKVRLCALLSTLLCLVPSPLGRTERRLLRP